MHEGLFSTFLEMSEIAPLPQTMNPKICPGWKTSVATKLVIKSAGMYFLPSIFLKMHDNSNGHKINRTDPSKQDGEAPENKKT